MNAKEFLKNIGVPIDYPVYEEWAEYMESYHQAKSKEGTVMLSDIEIENLAAKRWKRLNRRKPKMKEGKRQFAIRAFKAGYKAAFRKEGEI